MNKETLEKWLDILNYFDSDVQECAERNNDMRMYKKYEQMQDEMYNLIKGLKMKKRYKILMGEWVSVYSTTTMWVTTDKDIENMTMEQVAQLLDYDDNTQYDCEDEDFDWTTEEHEDWDRHDQPIHVLEKQEVK